MKIAIPANENNIKMGVCPSFGRAPFYYIYETDSKNGEFVENTAAQSAGGAGIKASQFLVDSKVGVVLTPRCGENAVTVLAGGNIKLFKTATADIEENIKMYENGELATLTDVHPGFHGHGQA